MASIKSLIAADTSKLRLGSAITMAVVIVLGTSAAFVRRSEGAAGSPNKGHPAVTEATGPVISPAREKPAELPIEYREIRRAGFDYEPPPIPFGELYPPR